MLSYFRKWLSINRVLTLKEKIAFYSFTFFFIASLIGCGVTFYLSKTKSVPKYGGEYIEGIVGQPIHVNPLISPSNSSDEDLVQVVYSSLLKYDGSGELIPDLAESYEISDDKMTYTFHLRKDVVWHDGQKLTANDVLFTVNLMSDPAYKSPLRLNWQGIDTSPSDDYTLQFKIKSPYVGFLNNLTFGILPKHIWESIGPDKFSITNLNLEPIGSGSYKYSSAQKDSSGNILSYKLSANPNYYQGKPYISKLTFNFYPSDDLMLDAYNKKEIMGISSIPPQKLSSIKLQQSTSVHKFDTPRYFAVFFNQTKSVPLASDEVRQALSYATDRKEIIDKILQGSGKPVYTPILEGMAGFSDDIEKYDFNLDRANKILEDNKWIKSDDGIRAKDGVKLEINIATTDWAELSQTADILKSQWEKVGAKININVLSISDIQQNYIRPREYEALLFGQVLGADPDPFSFWHSSQKKDPGHNLALFGNDDTDKLIEQGRVEFDPQKRASLYVNFQKKLAQENSTVFLYSPLYIYPTAKKVQNINISNLIAPSRRFSQINTWYIKTKRIWK